MINTLVFVGLFCIVAVLVYMARYSGRIRVSRTRLIDAPIAAVWAQVHDLGNWKAWNPWLAHGTDLVTQLHGTGGAPGSQLGWNSPRDGAGTVTLVRSAQPHSMRHKLRIEQPLRVRGRCQWTFVEREGKTEVSWQIRARSAFSMRAFAQTVRAALDLDCQYGLDRLAGLLEPASAPRYRITLPGVGQIEACRCVYQTYQGPIKGLPQAVRQHTASLREQLAARGVAATGSPLALYLKTNIKLRTTVCQIGLPVGQADVGDMDVRELPSQRTFRARLQGSSAALEIAWYLAMQQLNAQQHKPDQRLPPFERYLSAADGPDKDGVVEVHIPLLG